MIALFAGIGYAEADEKRRALGDVEGMAETKLWFFPRALARGYSAAGGRGDLEGARGVRVVRVLQGPRGGVRAADLPVRLAQGALAGALPGRGAHPRPGHVPQAADPRRRPPARHRDPRPRRQRLRAGVRRRAGRRGRARRLRHPARAGRGQGDQRGRGGPDRRGPALPLAHRLLAPRPGLPAGRRAAGAGRGVRRGLRHRAGRRSATAYAAAARSPGATCCSRWPSSTGTPGRSSGPRAAAGWRGGSPRPVTPGPGPGRGRRGPQQHRPGDPGGRPAARAAPAGRRRGCGRKAAAQSRATATPGPGDLGAAHPRPRRRAGGGRGERAARR